MPKKKLTGSSKAKTNKKTTKLTKAKANQKGKPRELKLDQSEVKKALKELVLQFLTGLSGQSRGVRLIVNETESGKVESKLKKADEKLGKAFGKKTNKSKSDEKGVEQIGLDDLDDVDLETLEKLEKKGVRIIYPNLKYRKPKYENVESVLNYVESEGGSGEVIKLVIMNFND